MYKYLLEDYVNNNIDLTNHNILYYLCYHINEQSKYPFLQIILEKIPYCNNLIKEELVLPSILIDNYSKSNIEKTIINNIFIKLNNIEKENIECLGIIDNVIIHNKVIMLVKINKLNIVTTQVKRNTELWITLPTEIVNNKYICDIPINEDVIELFENNFYNLCSLYSLKKELYPLPDVIYSINNFNHCKLENIFGRFKTIKANGHYLVFYRDYNSIKKHQILNKELGINRYIYFLEHYTLLDYNGLDNIDLTTMLVNYNALLIQNVERNSQLEFDIIVKDYDNIQPFSYYKLTTDYQIE
jgi:hypothetical protein